MRNYLNMFFVSLQFTTSSLSASMLTMNFGKKSVICVAVIINAADISLFSTFVCVLCKSCSEDVLPSIHADPEYPCELVGTWNTWYGEQDQAGKSTIHVCRLTHSRASVVIKHELLFKHELKTQIIYSCLKDP